MKEKKQFHCGAIATETKKCGVNLNKQIYIRSILDLRKVLMEDLQYNYIKIKYGEKVEMLLRDTDSLMYKIEGKLFMETCKNINSYLASIITKKSQNVTIFQITGS